VRDFRKLLATAAALDPHLPLARRVERLIDAVGYRAEVERTYPDELTRQTRWSAVTELVDLADAHQRRQRNASFATLLQDLALAETDDQGDGEHDRDVVTLMTLHSAKGLEFERVYLAGIEEGLLPHARSVAEDTIEEERRLMYVGITRAQKHLTLTYTEQRSKFGKSVTSLPSRFLFEIKGTPPPADWRPAGQETIRPAAKPAKPAKTGTRTSKRARAKSAPK
jgi:superfamily I DNA/RNA helicase